jgi:hypothetical protein
MFVWEAGGYQFGSKKYELINVWALNQYIKYNIRIIHAFNKKWLKNCGQKSVQKTDWKPREKPLKIDGKDLNFCVEAQDMRQMVYTIANRSDCECSSRLGVLQAQEMFR